MRVKESPFDYIKGLAPNFGINFFNGVNLTPVGQLESNLSEFSKQKNVISLLLDMSKRKPKHILGDELAKFLTDKKISPPVNYSGMCCEPRIWAESSMVLFTVNEVWNGMGRVKVALDDDEGNVLFGIN